jgi:hypothetical protein
MTTRLEITTRMTAEERYLAQKERDDNNPGVQAARNCPYRLNRRNRFTEKEKKLAEEGDRKYREDQIAGYGSVRYDFPEYVWWMVYDDGKKYFRSSKSWRVYDYVHSTQIVGTWNDETKKIEFI